MIIVDGVWWRRAVDPNFKPETVLPLFLEITKYMLQGRPDHATAPRGIHYERQPHRSGRRNCGRDRLDRVRSSHST